MNAIIRRSIAGGVMLTTVSLGVATGFAGERQPNARQPTNLETAPRVVSVPTSLSAHEMSKYQQKAEQSQATVTTEAAGADNKTVWIILGVAALVGVIALAAGGGGGGY
jgi:hypothetical protein